MAAQLSAKQLTDMVELCEKMLNNSYSPYSRFTVAAALLTDTGEVFGDCNVENVSYGLSICAERTAAVKAVSEGFTKFIACFVLTRSPDKVAPCGACRQFLAEFGSNMTCYLLNKNHECDKYLLKDLLPSSFTPEALESGRIKPSTD